MELLEIIGGAILFVACVAIIVLCLMQENKSGDSMTNALTGASSDSFYGRNESRSREAVLGRITRTAGIILFIATFVVNIIPSILDK